MAVHHALDVRQSSRQLRHRRWQAIRRDTIAASAHAQTAAAARADDGQQIKLESTAGFVQQLLAW